MTRMNLLTRLPTCSDHCYNDCAEILWRSTWRTPPLIICNRLRGAHGISAILAGQLRGGFALPAFFITRAGARSFINGGGAA